ncbi:PepSY-like domain-containing protein [Parabacteroides sp. OttesenSCG-928-G21]|nr:PepSY-like domain-containing protein [Parabacteroides sp. OttesenSCG-928-G21]
MNTKASILVLFTALVMVFSSCSDDDNYLPESTVVSAFNSKYPNAAKVEWEVKGAYQVVDFMMNSKESEAWFETTGKWIMTETDILFDELPLTIQTAFVGSDYYSWRIDDIDKLERLDTETVYIIEVEKGKEEYDLYYSEDGILIKAVADNEKSGYEPKEIPAVMTDFIAQAYPNASILEFEREGTFFEIDIRDGNIHKEVLFNSNYEWVKTEWDLRTSDVPTVVMDALKTTAYADYKIDDVEALETADGLFYLFELESGNKEVYVKIKSDGTIVQ